MDGQHAALANAPGPGALERWTTGARGPARILACVVVLSLPALSIALHSDDHHIALRIQQSPFAGFRFERGGDALEHRAWWLPRAGHLHFFRPISSLTHWLDFNLWPESAALMRVHSVLWYALLVLAVFALHRRLIADPTTARLATLLYALSAPHATSIGWIAARNTAVAALFGVLAVLLHDRGYGAGVRWARWLAPLALACALLGAEFGLCATGYLAAYEWCLQDGPGLRRIRRLLPYAAVVVLWWAYYVASGHGVAGSDLYREVTADPLGVLLVALASLPIYFATQLTIPIAGITALAGWTFGALFALSCLLLWPLGRWMAPTIARHRELRFYLAGAMLSVLPLGTTQPQDRLTLLLALGTSAVLAQWLRDARDALSSRVQRYAYAALYRLHLLWRPLLFAIYPFLFVRVLAMGERELEVALPRSEQASVLLLNPPSTFVAEQPPVIRARLHQPYPRYVYVLYAGRDPVRLRRVDDDTLELHAARGFRAGRLTMDARGRFKPGHRVRRRYMDIEVIEVGANGVPETVRFHFDAPLREGAPLLLAWNGGKAPEPVPMLQPGQQLVLPNTIAMK